MASRGREAKAAAAPRRAKETLLARIDCEDGGRRIPPSESAATDVALTSDQRDDVRRLVGGESDVA
jgi:hypothetical protein